MICLDIDNKNLENHMKNILKLNLCELKREQINCCPHCKSERYIKYGFYNGVQRFKCKECGKTFSLTTNFLWKYSKKEAENWIHFVELMLKQKSLRFCAEMLKISLDTAFHWRHKIIKALEKINIPKCIYGDISMVKVFMRENFKGEREIEQKERNKIWVAAAKGQYDSYLIMPVCSQNWSYKDFDEKVERKISKKAYVEVYCDRMMRAAMRKHNEKYSTKSIGNNQYEAINLIAVKMKRWFIPFRGINTKYLTQYLCWFILYIRSKKYNNLRLIYELCKKENLE